MTTLLAEVCVFLPSLRAISRWQLTEMKDVLKKLCRSKETHISFLKLFRTLGCQDNYAKKNHSVFPKLWDNKCKQFLKGKRKESGLCAELTEKKDFFHLIYLFIENEYE